MDNSRPITPPFIFKQNYQGRIIDDCDSMTISCFLVQTDSRINGYAHQLERQRHEVMEWSSWAKMNEKVVWDD